MEPAADTPAPFRRWRPLGRRWFGGPAAGAALVLLCLTVYGPGFASLSPVDRDESRFAQASRQMLESLTLPADQQERDEVAGWDGAVAPGMHSGGLVIPMVHRRARLNKPPLIYWLQAGSAGVLTGGEPLRDAIWMYRVPSALAGIGTVLLTWVIGRRMFDARAAWLGAAMLAVAPVFVWEAHQARADMALVTITTGAMGCLWMVWRGGRRGVDRAERRDSESSKGTGAWGSRSWAWAVALWVLVGLGVLTKGPVTPMVVGLSALALCVTTRRWRWVRAARPLMGVAIMVIMVAPWVWAVGERVGWEQYLEIVLEETLGRSASAKEGHRGPPGYHALLSIVLLWPGSMLIALALPRAWGRARGGRGRVGRGGGSTDRGAVGFLSLRSGLFCGRDAEVFLLCWIVPSWIVFELVLTKLPHYTMPMYPALGLLCARAVYAAETGRLAGVGARTIRRALGVFGAFSIGIGAVVVAAGLLLAGRGQGALAAALAAGAIVAIGASIIAIRSGRFARAQGTLIGAAAGLWAALLGLALPAADQLWVSERIAAQLPADALPVAAVGYHEDSLMYALRGRLTRIDPPQIEAWLDAHERSILIVPAELALEAAGLQPIGAAAGFNYAGGRPVDLVILRQEAP